MYLDGLDLFFAVYLKLMAGLAVCGLHSAHYNLQKYYTSVLQAVKNAVLIIILANNSQLCRSRLLVQIPLSFITRLYFPSRLYHPCVPISATMPLPKPPPANQRLHGVHTLLQFMGFFSLMRWYSLAHSNFFRVTRTHFFLNRVFFSFFLVLGNNSIHANNSAHQKHNKFVGHGKRMT